MNTLAAMLAVKKFKCTQTMKKFLNNKQLNFLTGILLSLMLSSCEVLHQVAKDYGGSLPGGQLTEQEVIKGLKSALEVGTKNGVSVLSKNNGYLADAAAKILLPSELNNALSQLKSTSAGRKIYDNVIADIEKDMIISLNRSAENAVDKAVPIFVNAIKGMTIQDGFNILKGTDDAATRYLRNKTFSNLQNAFQPEIKKVLDKPLVLNTSSEALYTKFVSTYNEVERADFINALNLSPIKESNLSTFVTQRALDGLFGKLAIEEQKIRENPAARVNAILKKVFGSVD